MKDPFRPGTISDEPLRSEMEQQAFFAAALERSLDAEARRGVVSCDILIAGSRLRLIFSGESLYREFMPALAHLEVPATAAANVAIHIWDSESTGVAMVDPICRHECFTRRGDIWGMASERIRSAFHWVEGSVNLLDFGSRVGIYWVPTAARLPYWAKASPLRTLLHWWMQQIGCQLLHAAAIGNGDGGVLIVGKGGLGKSTTALACLAAGMTYVGDDYVVVGMEPSPRAHSLYCTAKLNGDHLERFAGFRPLATNLEFLGEEKAVIQLHPVHAQQIARSIPLRAVLMPRVWDREATCFEAISKRELQDAAAFTTACQLPHAGRRTDEFVGRLIGALPGARILLGREIERISAAIAEFLGKPDAEIAAISAAPEPEAARRALISVVVPVHNGARFLPEAIESIRDQRYPGLEIIVVDDGSSDAIDDAVAALPVHVRYLKQAQGGASAARNRGINAASGDFIAFLDVDDLWPRDTLTVLADRLLERPDLAVVRGFAQLVAQHGSDGGLDYIGNPEESFTDYIGAGVYRRAAFTTIGLFDEGMRFSEDIDWFNRARERALPMERIERVTLLVRRHGENITWGKTMLELKTLNALKKTLERKRAAAGDRPPHKAGGKDSKRRDPTRRPTP